MTQIDACIFHPSLSFVSDKWESITPRRKLELKFEHKGWSLAALFLVGQLMLGVRLQGYKNQVVDAPLI